MSNFQFPFHTTPIALQMMMIFLFFHMFTSACVLIFCVIVLLLLNNQSSTKMKCAVRASPFLIAILPLPLYALSRFSHFHNNVFIYFYISIKSIIPSLFVAIMGAWLRGNWWKRNMKLIFCSPSFIITHMCSCWCCLSY